MTMEEGAWWTRRRERKRVREASVVPTPDFLRDDPGTPLGVGMPSGRALREDGDSHLEAWGRVVRSDPCALCGGPGGSLDHIEPRSRRTSGLGGAHSWLNYAGMCDRCNGRKRDLPLLIFMARRRGSPPKRRREVMVM